MSWEYERELKGVERTGKRLTNNPDIDIRIN
jgi:hypothetical protein